MLTSCAPHAPEAQGSLPRRATAARASVGRTVRTVAPQDRERPALTDGGLVLYRERNGWCPYSERVWLALEHKGIAYETEP